MPKGWKLEMVASEPTIQDPVNVAFGADGTVWVLEMGDYPLGGPKSGQLKRLIDRDGDGKYESSSVFLDGLSYPAGLYPWRDGIVVASAPEVFLAVDRDKDGVADERRSLIRGFPFANPQHRVHGFTYGLDHRLHFGTGSGVKEIIEVATGNTIQAGGSDLSLDVDTGKVYLETGSTQYIRGCDDWGNWFGNDNSHPLFHYVWDRAWSKYTKSSLRTQFQHVLQPATAPPVFPISREADRFNDLFAANRYTSACSSIFCRSPGATADMQECAMVCEPVHNLVSRIQIRRSGASFAGDRFVQDRQSEWMRSSDPWFRPVRIENAPDGTLWVVDMYRRVIEHPEWIPDDWQRRLNLRAGEDKGRIYRAYRTDYVPLAKKDWTLASISELLVALGSSSSAISDLARQQLIWRGRDNADVAKSIASELRSHSSKTKDAVVRLRCMAVLSSLDQANSADWIQTVRDSDERVARWGVESVAKQRLVQGQIRAALMDLASTEPAKSSTPLALQLIVALITCDEPAYDPFAGLLIRHAGDRWIDTVTSLLPNSGIDTVIERLLANANIRTESTINQLIASASQSLKQRLRDQIISGTSPRPAWHYTLCRQFAMSEDKNLQLPDVTADLVVDAAGKAIADESSTIDIRRSALSWYALRCGKEDQRQLNLLVQTLSKSQVSELQTAIIGALVSKGEFAMNLLFSEWPRLSTQTRANVISNCLSSPAHANFLMKQIEDKRISVGDFQPAQMETMRSVQEPGFAAQVVKYFGDPPGADRMAIVRDYHDRWPKAIDAGRGEALYKQHCAQCHQDKADATGTMVPAVGPNLQALAGWKNDAWLSAIFDPNRAVEPKYRRVLILTVDAQTMVGLKLRETETAVDFINEQGQMFSLPRASIDQLRESNKSLMPEGFEKIMTPEDTASVISFLRSNPSTAK
ncbi:MAG: PVC-type heme-binding CxxCH protein [Pirellula sp.]